MYAVVLPVLNEREALPWVLERMPAGYVPIRAAAALGARLATRWRPLWARAWRRAARSCSTALRGMGAARHQNRGQTPLYYHSWNL